MAEPTADAPPDWPQAGDIGYLVLDWDHDDSPEFTLDQLRRELRVFFVPDRDGALYYVKSGRMTYLGSPQLASSTHFDPSEVKPTLAEGLRESARVEREYGRKCLALADRLEALAVEAESEGGKSDG